MTLKNLIDSYALKSNNTDMGMMLVAVASYAANILQEPSGNHWHPVWMLLSAPSDAGKSYVLNAISKLPLAAHVRLSTEAALMHKRGGMLRETGKHGVWCIDGFDDNLATLPARNGNRGCMYAALREIYDGSWTRVTGEDGGTELDWEGDLGLIASADSISLAHRKLRLGLNLNGHKLFGMNDWDRFNANSGNRFLHFNLSEDALLGNNGVGGCWAAGRRADFPSKLYKFVEQLDWTTPQLNESEISFLNELGAMSERAEMLVYPDRPPRSIVRLVKSLGRLLLGMKVIGLPAENCAELIDKVAADTTALNLIGRSFDWESLKPLPGIISTGQLSLSLPSSLLSGCEPQADLRLSTIPKIMDPAIVI